MYIGSGLNTVSSLYGQQKGNQMKTPASGEKTFCTVNNLLDRKSTRLNSSHSRKPRMPSSA